MPEIYKVLYDTVAEWAIGSINMTVSSPAVMPYSQNLKIVGSVGNVIHYGNLISSTLCQFGLGLTKSVTWGPNASIKI